MAAVSPQKVSDDRLRDATGRIRADWHALLEAAGASTWAHPEIARWLVEEQGVDGWWALGITVGFEQAIGRRLPGQASDGTFAVAVTRTLAGSRVELLDPVVSALVASLGEPASLTPASLYSTARWKLDGETIVVAVSEPKPGRTLVSITRSRIRDGDSLDAAKHALRGILEGLEQPGGAPAVD